MRHANNRNRLDFIDGGVYYRYKAPILHKKLHFNVAFVIIKCFPLYILKGTCDQSTKKYSIY